VAISYPLDLLASFPGWSTKFELLHRQEQSRTASGITYVKDFGSPLWMGAWVTCNLKPNELDEWRARLDALENGLQTFKGYSLARTYPIAYPKAAYDKLTFGSVRLGSIGTNRKSGTLTGLPAGYKLSVGDMIEVADSGLHRIMEAVTANASGATPVFEVRPHFWPGASAPAAAALVRPGCPMRVVPGSITSDAEFSSGSGSISFQAVEAR
jgi:hypothetical protein